jgi:hypothetical protein
MTPDSLPAVDSSPAAPDDARHTVQLFDDDASLAARVAAFAADGWHAGDTLLIVATAAHWAAIRPRLGALGIAVDEALASGRLLVRDARQTLDALRHNERLDAVRFDAAIGQLVRTLAARARPIRVFGEMVDLLAGAGDFASAEQLEALWNGLARQHPFRLLCGYAASTFGDPRSRGALRRICGAHEHVHLDPDDLLGSFLVHRAQQH